MTKRAAASSRAYGSATLHFGLVTIPIELYTGTQEGGIKRKQFSPDGNAVQYRRVDSITDAEVEYGDIVSKIEASDGTPVHLADSEIEALFSIQPNSARIIGFTPQHHFYQGHYVPKGQLLYVVPGRIQKGRKKVRFDAAESALSLLFKAMKSKSAAAIVEITTRGKPKPAVLLPNGTLYFVYYDEEVREAPEHELPEVDQAYVEQAKTLIDTLWTNDPPELTDVRTELILEEVERKAREGQTAVTPEQAAPAAATPDLNAMFAGLTASVQAAKAAQAS